MTVIDHDFQAVDVVDATREDAARLTRRKRLFVGFAAGVALLGSASYAYDKLVASQHAVTDNAYVGADVAQVTPLIGGLTGGMDDDPAACGSTSVWADPLAVGAEPDIRYTSSDAIAGRLESRSRSLMTSVADW